MVPIEGGDGIVLGEIAANTDDDRTHVLSGLCRTGRVVYYVLPFDWSF